MAKLGFPTEDGRHPLAMGRLEFGTVIDIDDLDLGFQFGANRPQGSKKVRAEVAP